MVAIAVVVLIMSNYGSWVLAWSVAQQKKGEGGKVSSAQCGNGFIFLILSQMVPFLVDQNN